MRSLISGLLILLCFSKIANAKILFDSFHNGLYGIYVMDDDGSNIVPLIEHNWFRTGYAQWSPNGKKILFKQRVPGADGGSAYFLMNADGTNRQQLTQATEFHAKQEHSIAGAFSPDGRSFVFDHRISLPGVRGNTIKKSVRQFNFKSGRSTTIAEDVNMTAKDWSPDGRYIVFSTSRAIGGQGTTIWIMKSNGTEVRPLLPLPPEVGPGGLILHRSTPKWSPDGQNVLFTQKEYVWETREEERGTVLYLIHKAHRYIICDKKGSIVKRLNIPLDLNCGSLDWMNDGKSVLFAAYTVTLDEPILARPYYTIYKYDLEAEELTQITHGNWSYEMADWISDDVLSVTPLDKKKVRWGTMKQ